MEKDYCVLVFGKTGCDKCKVLNQRLDQILARPEWLRFGKTYHDLTTLDGLVAFSKAECVNPQRIPAMMVTRRSPGTGRFQPVMTRDPGRDDPVCGRSRLHQYVGLQTDYSADGKGVITPKMIASVLQEALEA